uniref:Uncharacterized protein n=1 Tax=Timema genevievae TaxID=629358 RepID=A0A7R9K6Z9_TIMGE|nr:unnamed protein product [Timema genevievae]
MTTHIGEQAGKGVCLIFSGLLGRRSLFKSNKKYETWSVRVPLLVQSLFSSATGRQKLRTYIMGDLSARDIEIRFIESLRRGQKGGGAPNLEDQAQHCPVVLDKLRPNTVL